MTRNAAGRETGNDDECYDESWYKTHHYYPPVFKHHAIMTSEAAPRAEARSWDRVLVVWHAAQLLAKLQAAPEVTVLPHSDSPTVMNGVRRALERAGHDFREDNN